MGRLWVDCWTVAGVSVAIADSFRARDLRSLSSFVDTWFAFVPGDVGLAALAKAATHGAATGFTHFIARMLAKSGLG